MALLQQAPRMRGSLLAEPLRAFPGSRGQATPERQCIAAPSAPVPASARTRRRGSVRAQVTSGTAWGPLQPLLGLFQQGKGSRQSREDAKQALLDAIAPLQRGVAASDEDKERVEELASSLEKLNPTPAPLKSDLINGQWELLYTTSAGIIGANKPAILRPSGPIYQCIDATSGQARNIQGFPYFGQIQATLTPVSGSRVNVQFDFFKILGLIPVKVPQRDGPQAFLDTTYLDEDLRISRGNLGNLFVLSMKDPSYRIEKPDQD